MSLLRCRLCQCPIGARVKASGRVDTMGREDSVITWTHRCAVFVQSWGSFPPGGGRMTQQGDSGACYNPVNG